MSGSWQRLAELPLRVERYELEALSHQLSAEFLRRCTVIHLHGGGHEGVGEDVTYAPEDHDNLQAAGPVQPLAGEWTLGSFTEHIAALDLFPRPPGGEVYRLYRRWAFDSAALDLALRQAGVPLHAALGREPRPVTFVSSTRLGEPPTLEPLRRRLAIAPTLHFKLDPTSSWDEQLIEQLVALDAIETLDLKGLYEGSPVDQPADPVLYRRVAEAFPEAWIEDPALTPETEPVLAPYRDRITWDAPLHSIADIEALPFAPKTVNMKPSRLGGLRSLLDFEDYCAQRGIGVYGGGQGELGPGRGQIQYLASLFHPDAPNDVAPSGYNLPEPPADLPSSPLAPAPSQTGFRWGD